MKAGSRRSAVGVIQLAYNWKFLVGDGCTERTDCGLTDFGRLVVQEMNRLGIVVDCSHTGYQTTLEAIELSIKALKEAMETDDADRIRARSQDLTEAAMKLGEAIYKAQAAETETATAGQDTGASRDDDVVDADFEDLGDDKKR